MQWSHAAFSANSEHVIATNASGGEQSIYMWDLHGQLTKMLSGPKDMEGVL